MSKAKEIAELGDKITVSGGTVTVADISTSTFSGTSIHSMQDVDLSGIAHNMFLKYNLSNTRFEVVAGNTSSIDEGTNLYYTNARADARIALANIDAKVASYLSSNDFDTATNIVASITDSAPSTLDTLNELAAALGDDANFSTTVTNSIATKLPLAGGTLTGTLTVTGANTHLDGRNSAGLTLDLSGTGHYTIKESTTNDIVKLGGTGTSNFIAHNISSGNVGIGTGAPADKMHIYRSSGTTVYKAQVNSNSIVGFGILKTGSTNQEWAIADGITVNGALQFYDSTDSAVRMQINGSGFVGIGTGNPTDSSGFSQALDVNGTNGAALYLRDNTDSKTGVIGQWNEELSIHSKQAGGTIKFYINNGHKMAIDSDGNVGIGETIPENILHIKTGAAGGPQIELDSTSGTANSAFINFDGTSLQLSTQRDMVDGSKRDTAKSWGGINIIGEAAGSKITFTTSTGNNNSASTRMTVDKDGNVGIGTATPGSTLDVRGEIRLDSGGSTSRSIYFRNQNSSSTGGGQIRSDQHLSLYAGNGAGSPTQYVTIKPGGNVGIGTNNPERPLHVKGSNAFIRIESTSASQNSQLDIKSTAATWSVGQNMALANTGTLEFYNGSSSPVVIKTNGFLGLGTTDPTEKLTMIVGNGGGILQSTFYNGTVTSGQKLGVIGFKGYSQGNTVAAADAKIEGVADGNHSGTSAPARLEFYVKHPTTGPGSAPTRRMQLSSYGELLLEDDAKGWASFYMNEQAGIRYHVKRFYTSSSGVTQNVMRVKRHYWGSGFYKISVKQQYYSSVSESDFYINGHGRNDGSYNPSYSLTFKDIHNGASGRINLTSPVATSPGNSAANYVDAQISIPSYTHWIVVIEAGGMASYSHDVTSMGGNDMYALH